MAKARIRQTTSSDDGKSERTVQSVSMSRRSASRSVRVNRGGRRSVTRGRRRFESAVAQFDVADRLRQAGWTSFRLRATPWHPVKIAGIVMAVAALALFSFAHTGDEWFVYAEDVEVRNLAYLDGDDVFRQSGVEGWNIFWLTPDQVSDRLLAIPYVETADVDIRLPAHLIIDIRELQPIALWVTKDATYWLSADGAALPAIAATDEGLPQLIDVLGEAQAITNDSALAVDRDVLASALALMDRIPALDDKIRYNRNFGLNFPLPEHDVWVYWGDGLNTSTKLDNLKAALAILPELEEPATLVDLRSIHRPYVR